MNRHDHEEDIHMVNQYMKRYSTALAIREIPIKTMMRCHYTPTRFGKTKDNIKC